MTGSGANGQLTFWNGVHAQAGDSGLTWNTATKTLNATNLVGNGSGLTSLNATNLSSGTVNSARISGAYPGLTGTGALTIGSIASGFGNINIGANTFTGNGSGLTNLNASNVSTGTLSLARGGTGAINAQQAINNISGLTTAGDLLTHNGANAVRLAKGAEGQCLTSGASGLVWEECQMKAGRDWVRSSMPEIGSSGGYVTISAIAYGNGRFVGVDSSKPYVAVSADGRAWRSYSAVSGEWASIAYGNGLFVAVARGGEYRVMVSSDGTSWRGVDDDSSHDFQSVAYGAGVFVAMMGNESMYSHNGVDWYQSPGGGYGFSYAVAYGAGAFVALPWGTPAKAGYSEDGIYWSESLNSLTVGTQSVAFGNGRFVAVGSEGVLISEGGNSNPGEWWSTIYGAPTGSWTSVAYGNGIFVAVALTGTNRMMVSTDGEDWTLIDTSYNTNVIGYGNGVFFAAAWGNYGLYSGSPSQVYTPNNNIYQGGMEVRGGLRVGGEVVLGDYTTSGGLLYANSSGLVSQLSTGSVGQCLKSNGDDAPVWGSCGDPLPTNNVTGTGVNGRLTFWNGTNTQSSSANLTWSGSLLNITGGLTVSGNITFSNFTTNNGLLYTTGTGALRQLSVGSANRCLKSGAGGSLSWSECLPSGTSVGDLMYWTGSSWANLPRGGEGESLVTCNGQLQWGWCYQVGDTGPAGGVIFYDKGTYTDGWRWMEAAPTKADPAQWGCAGVGKIVTGANISSIGAGKSNTIATVNYHNNTSNFNGHNYHNYNGGYGDLGCSAGNNGTVAAKSASDYSLNGYNDWFLPSEDEFYLLEPFKNQLGMVDSSASKIHWTSTEYLVEGSPNNGLWGVSVVISDQGEFGESSGNIKSIVNGEIRPVRAF